jgi:hypothetical protein
MRQSHAFCIAILAAAGMPLLAGAAAAQGVPTASRGFQPPVKNRTLPEFLPQAQPAALPGTLNLAEPADRTQLDLPPTESLFDAVNRGDIAAARDAISRGADIGGKNILGMTPLELSVDLGRNDITFLLLSTRAAASRPGPTTAASATAKPATKAGAAAAQVTPAAAPQVFARQDNGTPDPQAGFLGFGGSVQ